MEDNAPIIELDGVYKTFTSRQGSVTAMSDVSLELRRGEVISLVGESGSGKTTLARVVAGLENATEGTLRYRGHEFESLSKEQAHSYRSSVQYVHQDAYASLNPTRTVFSTLSVSLFRNKAARGRAQAIHRASELLELVDLVPATDYLGKYPHQLSGGQRQRVSLARALTTSPGLIVADESTSMLDVSIRISLLNTLLQLKDELGIGFLFITHDLALAKYFGIDGRTLVMYRGRIVEDGMTPEVIENPSHPYTRALVASIPEPDPRFSKCRNRIVLPTDNTIGLAETPAGCPFHPRCPMFVENICDVEVPPMLPVSIGSDEANTHKAACFRLDKIDDEMPLDKRVGIHI